MSKYYAWIKEISTIVYDNSKSEYQILSELIPILLDIKDNQNTINDNMNTFYDNLVNNIKSILADITNFNGTYPTLKQQISDILSNQNLLNDIETGFNAILNKINNVFENAINSTDVKENLTEQFNIKFVTPFNNRESLYIDLVSVTTEPSTANENDIYYNETDYNLYQYVNSTWTKINYQPNRIYRYNNSLYTIGLNITDVCNTDITSNILCKLPDGMLGVLKNDADKLLFTKYSIPNKNYTQTTVASCPENCLNVYSALYYNDIYYIAYAGNGYAGIATTTDLINLTKIYEEQSSSEIGYLREINNNIIFSKGNWLNNDYIFNIETNTAEKLNWCPYFIENNIYYGVDYIDIYTADNIYGNNKTLYIEGLRQAAGGYRNSNFINSKYICINDNCYNRTNKECLGKGPFFMINNNLFIDIIGYKILVASNEIFNLRLPLLSFPGISHGYYYDDINFYTSNGIYTGNLGLIKYD